MTGITTRDAEVDNRATNAPTGPTIDITNARLYVPVVALSTEEDKLLQKFKTRFKRTIKWNKLEDADTIQQILDNVTRQIHEGEHLKGK